MGVKVFRIVAAASLILLILLSQFAVFRFIPKVKAQELKPLRIYRDLDGNYFFKTLSNDTVYLTSNISLSRWQGECRIDLNYSCLLSKISGSVSVYFDEAENKLYIRVEYLGKVYVELVLYPLNITEFGALEFEIKVYSSAVFSYIGNNLTFPFPLYNLKAYYQPPLFEEYGFTEPYKNSTFFVNATHVMRLINGTWVNEAYRPENVVGSYAVYHATKTPFHKSKEEAEKYRAGKAFHIYRPKLIDAEGNEAWCNLNVSNNLLKIEIPQDFLDKAVYPVTIDPTFGYETVGSSSAGFILAGTYYELRGSHATLSEDGSAQSMTAYVDGTANKQFGIYDKTDGASVDDPLKGTTNVGASSGEGWLTLNFASPLSLSSGDYWLVAAGDDGAMWYDTVTDAGRYYSRESSWINDFPDPFGSALTEDKRWSIYCTYTAGAGDTTPPTYDANTLGTNTTAAGQPCLFHCNWSDDTGLSGFILEHNNTGTLINETWTSFDSLGTGNTWSNITLTLNSTVGVVIQWRIYANDTSNNWNVTDIQYLTTTFYAEITIQTTSHSWNIMPGQSNVLINEGNITITVTANANFTIQVKGSGDLTCGSHSIPLSNVKVHKDTLASAISLSTSWQDVPGLVNVASGTDITLKFKLWLSVPDGTPAGDYTYTLYIQVVQYNG